MGICSSKEVKEDVVFDPIHMHTNDQRSKLCKKVAQVVTGKDEQGRNFVNEYTEIKHLGSGTFGTVNLCQHYQTQELYAVKVIPRTGKKKANLDEAEILKKLRHLNVIQMFEVMDDAAQDAIYLVLEFVADGAIMSLDGEGHAKTPILPEPDCVKCMKQVIEGLEYLHSMNIIHRDIKPDNLLIDRKKDLIKLCDFGVGMLFENENDVVRKTEGTPFFIAPEACRGEYYSGKASDIWQLGITLYALVFGQVAFLASNQIVLFKDIQHKPLSIPPHSSSQLSHLLHRMLEKDPFLRISLSETKDHPWITGEDGPVPNATNLVASRPETSASCTKPTKADVGGTDCYHILIVEDVYLQRTLCRKIMEAIAVEGKVVIHEAADGAAAVTSCKEQFYNLIIMDVHMPVLNGFEATMQIRTMQREQGSGRDSWIVGLTADTHESVQAVGQSSGMNEVMRKPGTPASLRQVCVKYDIPLREGATVGFKPRALLKNGPRDLRRRGHAAITAYEKFLRKEGEEFAEASQCSGSEIDVKGAEWLERDADQRSVATSSRSSLLAGTAYEEHDLTPMATSQFIEIIRALSCKAEMQLSPQYYASLHERVIAATMAIIRRQMPNGTASRILFDEKMLQTHLEADLLQTKHTLRQVFIRSSGLHTLDGVLSPTRGLCIPPAVRCQIFAASSRGSETNMYQFYNIVPYANMLVNGKPLQLEADIQLADEARHFKVHLASSVEEYSEADNTKTTGLVKGENGDETKHLLKDKAEDSKQQTGTKLKVGNETHTNDVQTEATNGSFEGPIQDDAFVGLYDGHGATEVAAYVRDTLLHNLLNSACYPADLQAALIDAYRVTDKRIREWLNLNNDPSRVGTTAMAAVLRRDTLWIANAGDSHALLIHQDFRVTRLTEVHTPENEAEKHYVQKRGGAVTFREGAWRVNGELLVTRILGVPHCRRVVTCHPHVVSRKVNCAEDKCVLLAAGIWSVMKEAEVVQFLQDASTEVAASIRDIQQGPLTVEAVLRRRSSVIYPASRLLCDNHATPLDIAQRPTVIPPGATLPLPPNCPPMPEPPPQLPQRSESVIHIQEAKETNLGGAKPTATGELMSDYLLVEDHLVVAHALVMEAMARGCGENASVVLMYFSDTTAPAA